MRCWSLYWKLHTSSASLSLHIFLSSSATLGTLLLLHLILCTKYTLVSKILSMARKNITYQRSVCTANYTELFYTSARLLNLSTPLNFDQNLHLNFDLNFGVHVQLLQCISGPHYPALTGIEPGPVPVSDLPFQCDLGDMDYSPWLYIHMHCGVENSPIDGLLHTHYILMFLHFIQKLLLVRITSIAAFHVHYPERGILPQYVTASTTTKPPITNDDIPLPKTPFT